MGKIMTKQDKEQFDRALKVCQMVVEVGDSCGNCGVCGRGENNKFNPEDHEEGCPYLLAKEVVGGE